MTKPRKSPIVPARVIPCAGIRVVRRASARMSGGRGIHEYLALTALGGERLVVALELAQAVKTVAVKNNSAIIIENFISKLFMPFLQFSDLGFADL